MDFDPEVDDIDDEDSKADAVDPVDGHVEFNIDADIDTIKFRVGDIVKHNEKDYHILSIYRHKFVDEHSENVQIVDRFRLQHVEQVHGEDAVIDWDYDNDGAITLIKRNTKFIETAV